MKAWAQKTGGRPTDDEIVRALAEAFDAPESAAIAWLASIHTRFDARSAQERVVERGLADQPSSG